jgi:hypothetical protein
MKFGMGILLNGRKAHSWDWTIYPNPSGQENPKWDLACIYSLNHMTGENFIKQKM